MASNARSYEGNDVELVVLDDTAAVIPLVVLSLVSMPQQVTFEDLGVFQNLLFYTTHCIGRLVSFNVVGIPLNV